ncbi:MAG: hypothetical protein VKP72_14110 [bacterium]|nr:hypothetical protein [bacterium]
MTGSFNYPNRGDRHRRIQFAVAVNCSAMGVGWMESRSRMRRVQNPVVQALPAGGI